MNALGQAGGALMTCPVCRRDVPLGEFCAACGAHVAADGQGWAGRYHAFAANPAEHVLHPSVVSVLFPHLPQRHSAPFRLALLAIAALLLACSVWRLTAPAVAVAALGLPLLYGLYLYAVDIHGEGRALWMWAALALGVVVGAGWALMSGPVITRDALQNLTLGASPDRVLIGGVLVPLVSQLLMLSSVLVLSLVHHDDEVLDGFVFGAAGALGFMAAATVVELWPALHVAPVAQPPMVLAVLAVLQRGLLVPFIAACTTGLLGGALWLRRGPRRTLAAHGWTTTLVTAMLAALAVDVGLGLADTLTSSLVVACTVRLLTAAALLLLVRAVVHHLLLAEAVGATGSAVLACAHCQRVVPRLAFCPVCGIAIRATPKTGQSRAARAVR